MAGFRDFLMRFRPVGLPGPAAAGGVPADRSAELAAELEPPLALLEETEAEARTIREDADQDAARRRQAAERTAKDIVEQARARAPAVREESASRIRDATEAEATECSRPPSAMPLPCNAGFSSACPHSRTAWWPLWSRN
ncbi:hypothetical protein [Streptomyces sp. NBC_01615]|uniref:hypothetical protein n=1 Tax=Streptomyces sp. NBC_01615 TaxID=2975898 RepID=UPI00386788DE